MSVFQYRTTGWRVLKRVELLTENDCGSSISFGPFRLYPAARRIERDGSRLTLGSRALDILIALTERPGEVISHKELTQRAWRNLTVSTGCLRVHVAGLRKALGDEYGQYIGNVPGQGYCFVALITRHCPDNMPLSVPGPVSSSPGDLKALHLKSMPNGLQPPNPPPFVTRGPMEVAAGLVKLSPDSHSKVEAWRETVKSCVDEALAALAYDGAEIESWFRVKIHGQDYLLWYVRAESMQKV